MKLGQECCFFITCNQYNEERVELMRTLRKYCLIFQTVVNWSCNDRAVAASVVIWV